MKVGEPTRDYRHFLTRRIKSAERGYAMNGHESHKVAIKCYTVALAGFEEFGTKTADETLSLNIESIE